MDKRWLYPIVGGGFSTNIKKALISYLYPVETDIEKIQSIVPELVSGLLKDAVIQDFTENLDIPIPFIIYGELRELILNIPIVELLDITIPQLVNGQLRDALFYSAPSSDIDKLQLTIPNIVTASLLTPVFNTEAPETLNITIPTLVSGSLV
jgi:hypothetical protein